MSINQSAFQNAQSMARIALFSADKVQAESFWAAAMKSLKEAYEVK